MIRKLLVANRGEIARRIFRTAHSMGIATVAVYSDADSGMPHAREASEAVRLEGNSASETYLRGDLIVSAALATRADAIHPGYGFLSEDANFVRAVEAAGMVFVGPPASAVESMGSKLSAKQLARRAQVPTLDSVEVGDIATLDAVTELGRPLLVKASAGGGGRGMRVVDEGDDLAAAVASAQREAVASFGDGTVFLERYLPDARHVEVQVLGDRHGTVVHLFERDCSVQRRHQKIVEEVPSPAVSPEIRAAIGAAAVALAEAVGYQGAGTVEFLLAPNGEFFFLEMNTRLQVEHPVTEAVTGLDLVRLQIELADGQPLPTVVHEAVARGPVGHAIEARLYAEDPEAGYLPSTGILEDLSFPAHVRVDSGVAHGSLVSHHYDPMLAKVIAHASTRDDAARVLAFSLASARIHGPVTNRDLLVGILTSADFLEGRAGIRWLEAEMSPGALAAGARLDRASPMSVGAVEQLHACAAALALSSGRRRAATVLAALPSGWRNNPSQPQQLSLANVAGDEVVIRYRLSAGRAEVSVGDGADGASHDVTHEITLIELAPDAVVGEVDGVRRRFEVASQESSVWVDSPLGSSSFRILDRFPEAASQLSEGSLRAPMPGVVARVEVAVGSAVQAGVVVVVIEAMKMEHPVRAPRDGHVAEVLVEVGRQVDTGDVLAVLDAVSEDDAGSEAGSDG